MYKIGADPELFVKRGRRSYPAHGLVPGTKAEPHRVKGGAVQVDGMALEFNVNPSTSEELFSVRIEDVLQRLRAMVPKEYKFRFTPATTFPMEDYEAQPEEAKLLGCDPDFNAYTGEANPVPSPKQPNFRTTSGHVHVGWTNRQDPMNPAHFHDCRMLAIQLDAYLALPWMIQYGNKPEVARRNLYGKAGAFRPKPYGMEYRVLSNRWVAHEATRRWVFRATMKALNELDVGRHAFSNRTLKDVEDEWTMISVARKINTNKVNADHQQYINWLSELLKGWTLPPYIEGV